MSTAAVELEHVSKSYGERPALREVSFRLRPGEAVGYLGPNGAGKTTTLKLLAGLTLPDSGTVRLLGRAPDPASGSGLERVGVLVGTPGLVPYLTGRDLLDYASRAKGLARSTEQSTVEVAAMQTGFARHLDRPVGSLSTGLARRLLLAVALLGDPELLLLDEPTLGLDPAARADLRALLRGLRREGRTLLLSTHLLEDVEEVCDRVLFLRGGQLVGDEPVDRAPRDAKGTRLRSLRLRFRSPVSVSRLVEALPPTARVVADSETELTVSFEGEDAEQATLLAQVVGQRLPLLSASAVEGDLARRYLATVGREDEA
ncbi:MAG: ABC transporter ATP-binding protein [Thermoplasmata archaeon]|nr:ABC transporter ATP-binding protein [Thermoplasmata archaeon]